MNQSELVNFPTEFLNSPDVSVLPSHIVNLKIRVPIILLQNINQPKLCNGTRLVVKKLNNLIEAKILIGPHKREDVLFPRILLIPTDMAFEFKPIRLAFAMTINKAQGQYLQVCGLNLQNECFSHGQLYVACSRASMEKINFSGGEPFLPERGKHLGEMVKYCKQKLKLSVSIVSNGSLITERWFERYGQDLDILAISCDSFHEETNKLIGRGQGKRNHIEQLKKIRLWCIKYNVLFKINTVVNTYNKDENMVADIKELNPIRWKVFQCLLLEGENIGKDALRNAEKFYIDDESFEDFINKHKSLPCLVAESNVKMQNSYLILDEYMRFLDCQSGSKTPSKSILDIGVGNALHFSGFDEQMFKKRGGVYKWSKEANKLSW